MRQDADESAELDGAEGHQLAVVETAGASADKVMLAYTRPDAGGKVAECPLFPGIIDRMLAGWSAVRVSRWLGEHGYSISHETLWLYKKKNIEPLGVVTQAKWRSLLEREVILVDEVRELEELVTLQRMRVRTLLLNEAGVSDFSEMGENIVQFRYNAWLHKEVAILGNLVERLHRLRRQKQGLGAGIDDVVRDVFEQAQQAGVGAASAKRVLFIYEQLQVVADGGTEVNMPRIVGDGNATETSRRPRAELTAIDAAGESAVGCDVEGTGGWIDDDTEETT